MTTATPPVDIHFVGPRSVLNFAKTEKNLLYYEKRTHHSIAVALRMCAVSGYFASIESSV